MNRRITRILLALSVLALLTAFPASHAMAAETVHLYLKVDGQLIKGDSTVTSLGREDTIECTAYDQSAGTQFGTDLSPVTCVKRVDRSSPLLVRALLDKRPVEAQFRFFRPSPTGDGTTQQFYTITLKQAQVVGYRIFVPDTITPATASLPPLEEITLSFRSATWTFEAAGVSYTYTAPKVRETVPETAVTDPQLRAAVTGSTVQLSWTAVTPPAGKTLAGYLVYRSTDAGALFTPAKQVNDFAVKGTILSDVAPPGTYYYGLQAVWSDRTTTNFYPPTMVTIP